MLDELRIASVNSNQSRDSVMDRAYPAFMILEGNVTISLH